MLVLQLLGNIGIFLFVWVSSFLIHELMHIKGQGLKVIGKIYVNIFGMTVTANHTISDKWFSLSGGILTSIIMFLCVFLSEGFWQWSFLTLGWIQLTYGIYEGYCGIKYRYYIYIGVIIFMMIIWMVK